MQGGGAVQGTASHRRWRYSTRLLLSVAAIGAAGGILITGLNLLLIGMPPSGVVYSVYSAITPLWFVGAFLAAALYRLPGVGLLAALVGGVVNLVTPYGVYQLVNTLVAGLLIELPFALTRYRMRSDEATRWALFVSGLLQASVYYAVCWAGGVVSPSAYAPWLFGGTLAGAVASALIVSAFSLRVARRLHRAGFGQEAMSR